MSDVLAALAPTFLLILLGYGVRVGRIVTAEAMGMVNRFGYFILYPAFLFSLTARADFNIGGAGAFLGGVMCGVVVLIAAALATRFFLRDDGPAFTSVFQGSVRWNGFVVLTIVAGLYGQDALDLVGIVFGPLVLMINLVCVIVLTRWGSARATSFRALLDQIFANPLILACTAGLAVNALGVSNLGPFTDALNLLGPAAMPIALVCVGAALDFRALRDAGVKVASASVLKLAIAPIVLWIAATLAGASPLAVAAATAIGATPTAPAGYALAREMGGDPKLMAAIITATTALSFVTLPIALILTLPP
ncbi:MAG: AEC family transporter [Hyphomonadaceae bacterium]